MHTNSQAAPLCSALLAKPLAAGLAGDSADGDMLLPLGYVAATKPL